MARHMTQGIYQPHWRRMKEEPDEDPAARAPKRARPAAPEKAGWPETIPVHRIDGGRRG